MPRRTTTGYLSTHHQLKNLWLTSQSVFGLLSSRDQQLLHDYFRPSEDLTDQALLIHKATITEAQPSLPNRAGKVLRQLQAHVASQAVRRPILRTKVSPGGARNITVHAVRRPRPDYTTLSKALMAHVLKQQDAQAGVHEHPGLESRPVSNESRS